MDPLARDPLLSSPAYFSDLFRHCDLLHAGAVTAVTPTATFESPTATVALVALSYSSASRGALPASVAVKRYKIASDVDELITREVAFYRTFAPVVGPLPIVRCFAAEYEPELGRAFLVLEDRSAKHETGTLVAQGSVRQLRQAVAALATVHATFWRHREMVTWLLSRTIDAFVDDATYHAQRLVQLRERLGDQLPTAWLRILAAFVERGTSPLLHRLHQTATVTLAHSDPHFGNVLFPRASTAPPALLIDFAFVRAWWGARDIAFVLTFATDPALRRAVERDLVRAYHDQLEQQGVDDYPWDACWQDYRLGVLTNVRTPLGNRKAPYLWYRLDRAVQAYVDLECEELLA